MTGVLLISIMILSDAGHDLLMARAMKQIDAGRLLDSLRLLGIAKRAFGNPAFLAAIVMATLQFATFLALLSFSDLSFIVPTSALVYVLSTLGAYFLLRERVTALRWAGVGLIAIGATLVSLSRV